MNISKDDKELVSSISQVDYYKHTDLVNNQFFNCLKRQPLSYRAGGRCNRGNHRRLLGREELPFVAIRRPGHRPRHRCCHNPVAGAVHRRRARGWLSRDLRDATAGG